MMNFLFYHTPLFYLIQSVWRDEAFSYFMAQPGLWQTIQNTAQDFNPPLYYLLLHFWILVVGKSDEFLRILSFLFHIGSVYIVFLFAKKLFTQKYAFFVSLFTFFNPMLLYYAFEMRMYALYAFATFASFYFFYTRRWKKYCIAAVIGLYSHSFFPLVLFSFALIYRLIPGAKKKDIIRICIPVLFYLPWLPVVFNQFLHSTNSWIYPVDLQLIKSCLGNLFTSYEGTPGGLWQFTTILSGVIICFFSYFLFKNRKKGIIFLVPLFFPLSIILGYSVLKRPIYVNRYLIFVTVFEILALSYSVYLIQNKTLRTVFACIWFMFVLITNTVTPPYKKKTDFKTAFAQINSMAKSNDFVFAQTPIGFLESAYYFKDTNRVFVYNPQNIAIPYYIGANVVFPNSSKSEFPILPSRTFLVHDDARFELIIRQ
jgi:uncharacterized membrane protein